MPRSRGDPRPVYDRAMRVLVTGANRGIGAELVRRHRARGDAVVALVRDADRVGRAPWAGDPHVRVVAQPLDAPDLVPALRAALDGEVLDRVVANAGVLGAWTSLDALDLADVRHTFDVNVLGVLGVVQAALPALRRAPTRQLVAISSGMGSIAGNVEGGAHGYRVSKAALNMLVRTIARDLAPEGFTCVAMNPGWVQTDMGGAGAPVPVEVSVGNMLARLDRLTRADSGAFLDHEGGTLPW
jgi:NAD(P)-dependent dehydrogenase (short-subunit alcohol dehydrogenase family)